MSDNLPAPIHVLSRKTRHFFHLVSNIRPIVWIGLYICITPIFALIYYWLPDSQFRIPEGAGTDYGSWLYYSIVTITTLGFGDYTPAHGWAQMVTAIEVMCGLVFLGLFLNAVGSMKSEIDVESEIEKQRQVHLSMEKDKLLKMIPSVLHSLNVFLSYCYAVTTPAAKRKDEEARFNPDFSFNDLSDMFKPSGLPFDRTRLPAVNRLLHSASQTSLCLDSLQTRVDMTLWPEIVGDCFGFVANYQMFSATDALADKPAKEIKGVKAQTEKEAEQELSEKIAGWSGALEFKDNPELQSIGELYYFIKENADFAVKLEASITKIANAIE